MRVGEPRAAEVRHRIRLDPNDVIEQPESEILQRRADPKNIVIGADDPQCAVGLQDAPRLNEPGAREGVILRKRAEPVPVIIDPVDAAVVGAGQVPAELQIVGRVGEDEVGEIVGELFQLRDRVAFEDRVERRRRVPRGGCVLQRLALFFRCHSSAS